MFIRKGGHFAVFFIDRIMRILVTFILGILLLCGCAATDSTSWEASVDLWDLRSGTPEKVTGSGVLIPNVKDLRLPE